MENEKGREKPAVSLFTCAEAKRYQTYKGFRQVHDIHTYFDKISVRVVCFVPVVSVLAPFCLWVLVLGNFFCGFG